MKNKVSDKITTRPESLFKEQELDTTFHDIILIHQELDITFHEIILFYCDIFEGSSK